MPNENPSTPNMTIDTAETDTSDTTQTAAPTTAEENLSDHDKAMITKARENAGVGDQGEVEGGDEGEVNERPENVPEEFWNAETGEVNVDALLEAVASKNEDDGQTGDATNSDDVSDSGGDDGDEEGEEDETPSDLKTFFDGLDLNNLAAEIGTNGGMLTDETINGFVEQGIPEGMVREYAAGVNALAQMRVNEALEMGGGREQFEQMVAWAGVEGNVDPALVTEFNDAMNDLGSYELNPRAAAAIKAIQGIYKASEGSAPTLVNGEPGSGQGDVYTSVAELTADMRNPRYKRGDKAFHAQVKAKLRRSKLNVAQR